MNGRWELARRVSIFITWRVKEVHSIKPMVLDYALCNFRLTLSMIDLCRKMRRVSVCVCYEFFCNLLQNRCLKSSCPWDRHVRRLYLRDDPKSHFKEDRTISFHTNKSVKIFFCSISFLQSTCLLRPLRRNPNRLIKMSDFYHKDLVKVYQKQNLALSWFKPTSTLSSKYECWCEFEKDLQLLALSKIKRICVGASFLMELLSPFLARVFLFFAN